MVESPEVFEDVGDALFIAGYETRALDDHAAWLQHITEIGELLALGLIRLRARQSTRLSAPTGESLVDCVAHQSGHAEVLQRDDRA